MTRRKIGNYPYMSEFYGAPGDTAGFKGKIRTEADVLTFVDQMLEAGKGDSFVYRKALADAMMNNPNIPVHLRDYAHDVALNGVVIL